MLDGMRKASQHWAGRIVMAIVMGTISLAFAIWGVGDIFRGFGQSTVAKVGKTEISTDSLRFAYQNQLQALQQRTRQPITNEQARAAGLDAQVMAKLISDAALDERVRDLGLAMSDSEIAKTIITDPAFAGPAGKFDSNRFQEAMRNSGLAERGFANEQRKTYLRQEFVDAVAGNNPAPDAMLEAIHRYRDEVRSVEYIELPPSAAGEIKPPDQATLQSFFDARAQSFRAPEYRSIIWLAVTPSALADPASVSDADATALYDRVKEQRYGAPEKRELEQALFADEKTAAEAAEKIKGGADFEAAATEFKSSVVSMGDVTKAEMFDKTLADAAFALPENVVSAPVKGQFGYVLLRARKITAGSAKPYSEVANDLKKEIATERARKRVAELRDKIEDERTSGKTLAEAAKVVNLAPTTVDAVDQTGKDKNGKDVDIPVERDQLLRAAFASDIGVDNDLISTRDNGYVWFEVTNVEKARNRSLAEVKEQVEAAWREDEINRILTARANDLVKKLEGGETLENIAKAEGVELKQVSDAKRIDGGSLAPGLTARVFAVPVGQSGSAAIDNGARAVFKVLDAVTPPMDRDSDVIKGLETQLRPALGQDVLQQYLVRLQTDIGVTINQAVANVATGGAAEQQN